MSEIMVVVVVVFELIGNLVTDFNNLSHLGRSVLRFL